MRKMSIRYILIFIVVLPLFMLGVNYAKSDDKGAAPCGNAWVRYGEEIEDVVERCGPPAKLWKKRGRKGECPWRNSDMLFKCDEGGGMERLISVEVDGDGIVRSVRSHQTRNQE